MQEEVNGNTAPCVSEIERSKKHVKKRKRKAVGTRHRSGYRDAATLRTTNQHEQFFCETILLLADNKKRITDIDTTIIRTIIIVPNTPSQPPYTFPVQSHGVQAQFMTQKSTLTPQHAPNSLITHIIYAVFFQSIWCFCILSSKQRTLSACYTMSIHG